MMLPQETTNRITGPDSATLHFYLQPELFWFKGHFPQRSILPGVTQIHWALHYATEIFSINHSFSSIDMVKFQLPLPPKEHITLMLNWDSEKSKLSFQYQCNGRTASSGRMSL
ncbi:hydroxymyristoyl-ACP dehydratase [Budvicia diplopodorum]|uniref:ApeI family dehydratase n=1 Tax=Budvicia diplopodorum TaxID=1119056 RepID=UPI0013594C1F|nr:hydroxymyristoyl-ACP dehydratase [Budvicia diplopodorum]